MAIAKLCGIDPSERAARSWLSSSDRPWLLIIDNADDAKLDLERYLPDGEHGLTLITTRNPSIKMHGTIGQRFYHFDRLDDDEASQLLLRAAEHHEPPTSSVLQWTVTIAEKLGSLPLALIHAGNAIKAKYCGFETYLDYYDHSWQMIRQSRRGTNHDRGGIADVDEYMEVYSSYEILYRGLEAMEHQSYKDALQLLQLFSFFHHEHISFDILIAAVRLPNLECEAQEGIGQPSAETGNGPISPTNSILQPISWLKDFRDLVLGSVERHIANRNPTILPTFLRDAELSPALDDFNVRLRKALHELVRLSLVTYHEASDSYSMHPLVHTWVRERPQMTTTDQAVWCEAALATISRCILLPPLSSSVQSQTDLLRKLLPHLSAAEKRQERIQADFLDNQKTLWRPWPPALKPSGVHPKKALQLTKSSLVYAQCGYFVEAEAHQRTVRDFVFKTRGPDHPRAMDITLALAATLRQECRANEAADLQDQVLQVCLRTLGPDHPQTLKVMNALGQSRLQQGQLGESIRLHKLAIEGMKTKIFESDPAMFHALEQLGNTLWYCFLFEEAKEHQEKAVAGLKRLLGDSDLKTLIAIEALSKTYLKLGTKHLESNNKLGFKYLETARRDMEFVIEQRTKQLGENQPYTWLGKCNLGAIQSAMGDSGEGERLIRSLLPMAVAHMGEDHLAVLAGKCELARIVMKQERYLEAQEILLDISKPEKYRKTATANGDHPDRCDALFALLECYQKQDKIDDGLRTCDEIETVIFAIRRGKEQTETSSTFWQMVQDKRAELLSRKNPQVIEGPAVLESGSSTEELRPATLQLGMLATSSNTHIASTSGGLRKRETT